MLYKGDVFIAYFLKFSLIIFKSMILFRIKKKKHSAHKSYKALGYLDDLIASGIDDPISFYKADVDKLNKNAKIGKEELAIRRIYESPVKNLYYF